MLPPQRFTIGKRGKRREEEPVSNSQPSWVTSFVAANAEAGMHVHQRKYEMSVELNRAYLARAQEPIAML